MLAQNGSVNRFATKSCRVVITDVRGCVMQTAVVIVQEQDKGNVPVDKLLFHCPALKMFQLVVVRVINP